MKVKIHATYTVQADYEFEGNEWKDKFSDRCMEWVKEDFTKIDTRVSNVISEPYHTNLTFQIEENDEH